MEHGSHAEYQLKLLDPTGPTPPPRDDYYTWHCTSIWALSSILAEGGMRKSEEHGARELNACWTTSSGDDPGRADAYAWFCPFGPANMYVAIRVRICCDTPQASSRKRTSLIPVHRSRVSEVYLTVTHVCNLYPGAFIYTARPPVGRCRHACSTPAFRSFAWSTSLCFRNFSIRTSLYMRSPMTCLTGSCIAIRRP